MAPARGRLCRLPAPLPLQGLDGHRPLGPAGRVAGSRGRRVVRLRRRHRGCALPRRRCHFPGWGWVAAQ
eukprot:1092177-Alexandrium_andersonii.AAC.1